MILIKADNYDELVVNEDRERIELGGHRGIIKTAEEYKSSQTGNKSLKVEVDTDKTDKQPNFFQKQYDENTSTDKKWSNAGTKYVPLGNEEKQIKMLKAFITAVENSNTGFKYDWSKDTNQLIGKKVGLMYGLEEYTDNEGKTRASTKLTQFRSIDKVDNAAIPKVKLLDKTYIEYEEYKAIKDSKTNQDPFSEFGDAIEISDNILD